MAEIKREVREIPDRLTWLQWRRNDLTASRIAALFSAHPYLSREQLADDLRGLSVKGDTPAMRRGRILEPAVAAALAEEHPDWTLTKATTYHRLPQHRLGATPDLWLGDDGLVQIKTVDPREWEKWRGKVPLAYSLQTLTELLVTGRARGVLAVMVLSSSFPVHEFEVPRHASAEKRILEAVKRWWHDWDRGKISASVPAEAIAAEVDDGSHLDLSSDNELAMLLPERAALKANEKRLAEIDEAIKAKLGTARTAWLPGWSIAYPTLSRKEYVVKAGTYRRLTIKENDGV